MKKLDAGLVSVLADCGSATAVVRVRSPWQLASLERRFDVVARFPFISAVGVCCDRKEAVRLASMQEVVSVTAQRRVCALDDVTAVPNGGEGYAAESFAAVGFTGRGVTLCVLDTGVAPHLDISVPRDRIKEFHDFVGQG